MVRKRPPFFSPEINLATVLAVSAANRDRNELRLSSGRPKGIRDRRTAFRLLARKNKGSGHRAGRQDRCRRWGLDAVVCESARMNHYGAHAARFEDFIDERRGGPVGHAIGAGRKDASIAWIGISRRDVDRCRHQRNFSQRCRDVGRPGMDDSHVVVLADVRLGCNLDYDKL